MSAAEPRGPAEPPPAGSVLLEARGISRAYGRLEALRDFSLGLGGGECVALVGANGSGKSTAVRLLAGLLEPTAGAVRVCGADPHAEPEAQRARAHLALVPDQPLLYGDLTVGEHLELVAVAHGVAEPADSIDALLERLGIAHRRDFRPAELSRGMRQKAQLACAFVRPADVLVLDEPVVGLDPPSQELLRTMLDERKAAGCAVLLTTHQLGFAEEIADRAIRLDEGVAVDSGSPREVAGRAAARGWTAG